MGHAIIAGITGAGKTLYAQATAFAMRKAGWPVLVHDQNGQKWFASKVFTDISQMLDVAKRSTSCILIVDEAGASIGRYATELQWLATQSRHRNHRLIIVCQRPTQVDRNVRDQVENIVLFLVSNYDAKTLAEEWPLADLRRAATLDRWHFLQAGKFTGRAASGFVTPPGKITDPPKITFRSA